MSLSLGLLIPQEKKKKIRLPERIESLCKEKGITITDLDVNDEDLLEKGPFDVFVHKIADSYNEFSKEEAQRKISIVKQFVARFPKMFVIDNIEAAELMTDRKYQTEILKSCEMVFDNINVFVPKILEIPSKTSLVELKNIIVQNNVQFPILAKPLAASLQEDSHSMTLVFSQDRLEDIPLPCLLQEFCNHDGIVYKVFVVGDKFNMCERPSIKNIDCSSHKTLKFDTRNVSKTGKAYIPDLHEADPNKKTWASCDDNPDMLNQNVIEELCKRIQAVTGLQLFGFDILVETGTGRYAFIDVNHFPGYAGINENYFSKHLVELIHKEGLNRKAAQI